MKENKIRPPHLKQILQELNQDLKYDLQPLVLPRKETNLEEYDARMSEIAGCSDGTEFFLKRKGLIEVPEDIKFKGDVGNVCHRTVELTAPQRWRDAMEQSRIVTYIPKSPPLEGEELKIRFTPDVSAFHSSDIGIMSIENKSSLAPYQSWSPKIPHAIQAAGYVALAEMFLEEHKEEHNYKPTDGKYAAVVYFRDPIKSPRIIREPIQGEWKKTALSRTKNYINMYRRWENNPALFLVEYEEDRNFGFKAHLESKKAQSIWPAVVKYAKENGLYDRFRNLMDKIEDAYQTKYGARLNA